MNKQVLFDRITWNREVVVQEASPLMFFLFIMRCTGIEMRTVRFFFFDRDYEVCRLDLIFFVYGYSD